MTKCACGCGGETNLDHVFIHGHNRRKQGKNNGVCKICGRFHNSIKGESSGLCFKGDKKEYFKLYGKLRRDRNKNIVLSHYCNGEPHCMNPKCEVPGGTKNIWALTIDHIDGGGCEHKRQLHVGSGAGFYAWIIRNNFPEGLQVLCMSCQFVKMNETDECSKWRNIKK